MARSSNGQGIQCEQLASRAGWSTRPRPHKDPVGFGVWRSESGKRFCASCWVLLVEYCVGRGRDRINYALHLFSPLLRGLGAPSDVPGAATSGQRRPVPARGGQCQPGAARGGQEGWPRAATGGQWRPGAAQGKTGVARSAQGGQGRPGAARSGQPGGGQGR